jgi:aminopeptidase N
MRRHLLFLPLVLVMTSCDDAAPAVAPGVSRELAEHRARAISGIRYSLFFSIPDSHDERVTGIVGIRFTPADASDPLVLDFTAPEGSVRGVRANQRDVMVETRDGHIVVPAQALVDGENLVEVEFLAGDLSLNRNPDYLYTLFVPDRASSAFPSFDQPDLKAVYALTLETPAGWEAVANGAVAARDTTGGRTLWTFEETAPISTYLFSFAAGQFRVETDKRGGRTMRMYHRETDTERVRRNRNAIFELHRTALTWLEQYTGIAYPFDKFDFVLIPSFQYNGMEHPGAILYQASSLFLEESATQAQELGRASLIAHETAHMWFGNLVTMEWFDDVWMKEVFANFMAAKIVNPSFPDVNHRLRFFLAHHPSAYAVDRTRGANPIRQDLDNLRNAGTLYGAIIYQKAPIVMRHLEVLMGADAFRDGLRAYLDAHRFGNATWSDLIAVLDRRTGEDLATWSDTWVEEPGRPRVQALLGHSGRGVVLRLEQSDPLGRGLRWTQEVAALIIGRDDTAEVTVRLRRQPTVTADLPNDADPAALLPGSDGLGYAHFVLDAQSRDWLLAHLPTLQDPVHRAVGWVTLWDAMLEGEVPGRALVELALSAAPAEADEQNLQRVLGYLAQAFWKFLDREDRTALAPRVERMLWQGIVSDTTRSRRATYFDAFVDVALTDRAVGRLHALWSRSQTIAGLPLAERHFTRLAYELAVRGVPDWELVLERQESRIENPDRLAQFQFVRQAVVADPAAREAFFQTLLEPENREHEPWVLEALAHLHHPLRAESAIPFIRPSLEELEEIRATGDIFFPGRWLGATFSGHRSVEAARIVEGFLAERPGYPPKLREKILQEADDLFRAAGR